MILPGKNLIISRNGEAMFASKSCDVNIQAETIPASSPTDGSWVHRIAGRKSWSLITNHLMAANAIADGHISAQAFGYNSSTIPTEASRVVDGTGAVKMTDSRGISAITLGATSYAFTENSFTSWDTFGTDPRTLIQSFEEYLHDSEGIIVLVTYDAFALPQEWVDLITTYMHVTPPVCAQGRYALVAIGGPNISLGTYQYTGNNGEAARSALAEIYLNNGQALSDSPVKDAIDSVGIEYTMKCNVLGLPYDEISGPAICKQFRVTGTRGNLLQGSFSFEGSGPLE